MSNHEPQATYESTLKRELGEGLQLYVILPQRVMTLNEDQLRWHLKEVEDDFGKRNAWHTPLGIGAAIVTSLITTKFEVTWGLEAGVWKGIFIAGLVACLVWLVVTGRQAIRAKSIDDVVNSLMEKGTKTAVQQPSNTDSAAHDPEIISSSTSGLTGPTGVAGPSQP